MTEIELLQIALYFILLIATVKPLGTYIYKIYSHSKPLTAIEKLLYKLCRVDATQAMTWHIYAMNFLLFNFLGIILVYLIARTQHFLPLNTENFININPILALNTAISFATNTNWQAYAGENTLSYLTQMLALGSQNFLSAASGIAIAIALCRSFAKNEQPTIGNFWTDLTRGILYILLPLALLLSTFLISEGAIQNFNPYQKITTMINLNINSDQDKLPQQVIPMGPVASQVAIKLLGTNGGGFFNANSAHPFENPTPLTNLIENLAMLLIPAALCYTFGLIVNNKKQGWMLFTVMATIFLLAVIITVSAEIYFNNASMEGKETRFGVVGSALWAVTATATSAGATNSALDSFAPLSLLILTWLMQLGEVIFGGVGTGLTGMLVIVMLTVLIAGLMIGKTPEYLGKKIEPFEIKMIAFIILMMPLITLTATTIAIITKNLNSTNTAIPHIFTEVLYNISSLANNNGSSLSGLSTDNNFYNITGSILMLCGRYWFAIPILALAGSLAKKKILPQTNNMLPINHPIFGVLLGGIVIIIGALTFLPALSLGPIIEYLNTAG